jgi:hypothetical protein
MADDVAPRAPEEYPQDVRDELHQTDVTHEGDERREGDGATDGHMGAVETEVASVTPPMEGPSKIVRGSTDDAGIDPREELHGG